MRFTLFDSIGQGLRDTKSKAEARAKPVASATTLAAIEDFINYNMHRSVIIDADGRHGLWLGYVNAGTLYAFHYPDEIEWLLPVLAFKNFVKKAQLGDPAVVLKCATIEKRPHPDKAGVTAEFVVWREKRPKMEV